MDIIFKIFSFLSDVFVKIFMEAQSTPAIEEEVHVEEGNLAAPDESDYDGLYGLSNSGDQAEE